MKEYLLLFRSHNGAYETSTTPEELQASMEAWRGWMADIAKQGKLVAGQPLATDGRHMPAANKITDAPFAEGKEVVNGYLLIKAGDYDEACKIASACPIFGDSGGSVEVREIMVMDGM